MTRVSCIVPVRDRKELVCQAIESALAQQHTEMEIVVVDDGSVDGTFHRVSRRFPGITVLRAKGLGPGRARNYGVQASSGQVLMFLDSDDLWCKNHCRLLLNALEGGIPVSYGVTRNMDLVNGSEFYIPDRQDGPSGDCFDALLRWCFMVPSSFAVTRKAFLAAGGFGHGSIGEDWSLFLRLSRLYPIAFVPEVVTIRRLHEKSLCCQSFSRGKALDMIKMLQETAVKAGCIPREISRLQMVFELTERQGEKWLSVQDWYIGLKMHNLI